MSERQPIRGGYRQCAKTRLNAIPILVVCEIYPCSHFSEITDPTSPPSAK